MFFLGWGCLSYTLYSLPPTNLFACFFPDTEICCKGMSGHGETACRKKHCVPHPGCRFPGVPTPSSGHDFAELHILVGRQTPWLSPARSSDHCLHQGHGRPAGESLCGAVWTQVGMVVGGVSAPLSSTFVSAFGLPLFRVLMRRSSMIWPTIL